MVAADLEVEAAVVAADFAVVTAVVAAGFAVVAAVVTTAASVAAVTGAVVSAGFASAGAGAAVVIASEAACVRAASVAGMVSTYAVAACADCAGACSLAAPQPVMARDATRRMLAAKITFFIMIRSFNSNHLDFVLFWKVLSLPLILSYHIPGADTTDNPPVFCSKSNTPDRFCCLTDRCR